MKTTFTYVLRSSISVLLLSIAFSNSYAQTGNPSNSVNNLKVSVQNNNLMVNWMVNDTNTSNYCEVQASNDGKTFTTIGLVMGADPKQNNNSFAFKQGIKNIKAGQVFYRVLNVGTDGKSYTSNVIEIM